MARRHPLETGLPRGQRKAGSSAHMRPPAKTTVEECLVLEVQALARAGFLGPGLPSGVLRFKRGGAELGSLGVEARTDGLHLEYDVLSIMGGKTKVRYVLTLVRTPVFNGERVWFSCPGCEKRVGKLYLPPGKNTFLCRSCHDLTYASRQRPIDIWQKVRAERPKLEADLLNPRVGIERQLKAAMRIEELRAQAESARNATRELLPPVLLALLYPAMQEAEAVPRQPSATPVKLSRGRPRLKRPYQRTKPFHQGKRRTATQAFCVKCRDYCEPPEWTFVSFKNGAPALQGRCPTCGSKVARIITEREAAALAGAEATLS
jgi:hypothetical protein